MPAARRALPPLAAAILAVAVAGCGTGAGGGADGPATLLVTRDFGRTVLLERRVEDPPETETVMRLLQRNADVETRYGGGFVQCVDGLCAASEGGRRADWFYFVNGVEASKGAAATRVRRGETIWWDRRDWSGAQRVPAVVGAFPQPFRTGTPGEERLPVRVECSDTGTRSCERVRDALTAYDIPAAKTTLRTQLADETLRVLVGPWRVLRADTTLALLEQGPGASGVFAAPRPDGRSIALLGPRGRTAAVLRAGGGLVAATVDVGAEGEPLPVWAVTGTDEAGVAAAADAFAERTLRRRFAVAVPSGAAPLALPVQREGST